MIGDLFGDGPGIDGPGGDGVMRIGPQAWLLRALAAPIAHTLLDGLRTVFVQAPLRHMITPGGFTMSVATSNCGDVGWISDRRGYRYVADDPQTGQRWPAMPAGFRALAVDAAERAGFAGFEPDACLINRYAPGTRLSLHQDRDERDFDAPIVSVSLGLPATFLFGGLTRRYRPARVGLTHGDVVVWGGVDRLRFHGVLPVKDGCDPRTGDCRLNLTFRRAR